MLAGVRNLALVAVAGLAFGGIMYLRGQSNGEHVGEARERLKVSEIELARLEVTRDLQAQINELSARQSLIETNRQEAVREIRIETESIVEKPVYRTVCIDVDGVRILDDATAVANGNLSRRGPTPFDAATASTERAPDNGSAESHMTGADCLWSLIELYDYAGKTRAQLMNLQAQMAVGSKP